MTIADFAIYLTAERNYSAHTVISYTRDVEEFQQFLQPKPLYDATKKDVKKYLSNLLVKGRQERTINRKLSSLQAYYKFLLLTETIEKLPTEGVKSLKFYKKVQIPISEKEVAQLFDEQEWEDTFTGHRNNLILQLLYFTGMRRAELIGLRVADVDLGKLELKVTGKRDKERIIPFNKELAESIQEYLTKAKEEGMDLADHLLVTQQGKKLYPKLVYNVVNSYLSVVTDKHKKSPHILRHSFASHFMHKGAEINAVKEILGHESLAATQLYTHNDIEHLKKVFNQTHPRESKNK